MSGLDPGTRAGLEEALNALVCPAKCLAKTRLTGRFLFLHTQKHTQEFWLHASAISSVGNSHSALRVRSRHAAVLDGDACNCNPSAAMTFMMVANSGLPSADSAL